jgi:hypothetical protein
MWQHKPITVTVYKHVLFYYPPEFAKPQSMNSRKARGEYKQKFCRVAVPRSLADNPRFQRFGRFRMAWIFRQQVPSKRLDLCTQLHGVTLIFITIVPWVPQGYASELKLSLTSLKRIPRQTGSYDSFMRVWRVWVHAAILALVLCLMRSKTPTDWIR